MTQLHWCKSVNIWSLGVAKDVVMSVFCVCFFGKPMSWHHSSALLHQFWGKKRVVSIMKIASVEQKRNHEEKMKNRSKAEQYLIFGIHTLAIFFGLSPYKINKATGEFSFRWISWEAIWSLARLVVFNAPLSFLPLLLLVFYGPGEWKPEELQQFVNATSEQTSTSTVAIAVCAVEYISCYSYFILSKAAKKSFGEINMLFFLEWKGCLMFFR